MRSVGRFILIVSVLLTISPAVVKAQQADSAEVQRPDLTEASGATDLLLTKVEPVRFNKGISYQKAVAAVDDSLMRWHLFSNLREILTVHYPSQHFSMDGFSRQSLIEMNGVGFRDMTVRSDGFTLNSPINGLMHQSKIPYMRIAELQLYPQSHRIELFKREYYKLEPITHISVDQSSHGFNSVGGHIVLPVNKRTAGEFGLWNRGYGGEYQQSETSGIQLYAKIRVQPDSLSRFRAVWQYDVLRQEQSDGYAIADLNTFSFNRFVATPLNSNAYSSEREHRLYAEYDRQRENFDLKLGASVLKNRRFLYGVDDSVQVAGVYQTSRVDSSYITFYDASALLNTGYQFGFGALRLRSQPGATVITDDKFDQFGKKTLYRIPVEASTQIGNASARISVDGGLTFGPTGLEQVVSAETQKTVGVFEFQAFAGAELKQQDPQLRWFNSDDWKGTNLDGVFQSWFGGRVLFDGLGSHEVGARYSPVWHQAGVTENTFDWAKERQRVNVTYRYSGDTDRFEWNWASSATFVSETELGSSVRDGRFRQYHTASLYYKDFWFNRATYIKMGILGRMAPTFYYAERYMPQFDRYLTDLTTRAIPGWYGIDAEMSARIRQMIVYIKAENIQQGTLSNGHFEIADYPHFSRRFRFGLRVIFIN